MVNQILALTNGQKGSRVVSLNAAVSNNNNRKRKRNEDIITIRSKKETRPPKRRRTIVRQANKHWLRSHGGNISHLTEYLTAPDIFGPCRIPRAGGASRTILGETRTIAVITGSATLVQGFIAIPQYNTDHQNLSSLLQSSVLTVSGGIAPTLQFPINTSLDDVSIVAQCMTISTVSPITSVGGELLIGTVSIDNSAIALASYNSLAFYPGFLRVPLATTVSQPLRVWMTKNSPDSDAFYGPGANIPDIMHPVLLTSNLPVGLTCTVEITTTYECHASVATTNAVPYEASIDGLSQDLALFTNTVDALNHMSASVEVAQSQYVQNALSAVVGLGVPYLPAAARMARGMAQSLRTPGFNRGNV